MSNQSLKIGGSVTTSNIIVGSQSSGAATSRSTVIKFRNMTANYLNVVGTTTSGVQSFPRNIKIPGSFYTIKPTGVTINGSTWTPSPSISSTTFGSIVTTASSPTISFTTTTPNELVCIINTFYWGGLPAVTISSITDFSKRAEFYDGASIYAGYSSYWYSIVATPGTYSKAVTFTGTPSSSISCNFSLLNINNFAQFGTGTSTNYLSQNINIPAMSSTTNNVVNTTSSKGSVLVVYIDRSGTAGPGTSPINGLVTYSSNNFFTIGYYNFSSVISNLNLRWSINIPFNVEPAYLVDLLT